jgi:hypothetical protein
MSCATKGVVVGVAIGVVTGVVMVASSVMKQAWLHIEKICLLPVYGGFPLVVDPQDSSASSTGEVAAASVRYWG